MGSSDWLADGLYDLEKVIHDGMKMTSRSIEEPERVASYLNEYFPHPF